MPRHTHSGVIITDFCEVPAEKDCVRKQWDAPYLGGGGYAKALQLPKHSHPHCWIASRMIRCIRQPPYIMGAAQHGVGWDQLHSHEPGGSPEAQLIAKKQGEVRLQSALVVVRTKVIAVTIICFYSMLDSLPMLAPDRWVPGVGMAFRGERRPKHGECFATACQRTKTSAILKIGCGGPY